MWSITRDYWFAAAHRLEGHPKCGRLHGHNYKAVVELTGKELHGRWIMDYGDLDKVVKPVIKNMDHKYLLSEENGMQDDPYMPIVLEREEGYFIHDVASTAECIARCIYEEIRPQIPSDLDIAVTIWETPKSSARYAAD
jgi:6-pyruvoyltetrahydropterin/6-carboxytetrahydropterin synthase